MKLQKTIALMVVGASLLVATNAQAQQHGVAPGMGQPVGPAMAPGMGQAVPHWPGMGQSYLPRWTLDMNVWTIHGIGVKVASVNPYGAAERMGLEQGDIVTQVNGRPIRGLWDLRRALDRSNGYVRLMVRDVRTGQYMWVNGNLSGNDGGTAVSAQ